MKLWKRDSAFFLFLAEIKYNPNIYSTFAERKFKLRHEKNESDQFKMDWVDAATLIATIKSR